MNKARADKLIDLHCALRKVAFSHVEPAVRAEFDTLRAQLTGAKHASELAVVPSDILRHLTSK